MAQKQQKREFDFLTSERLKELRDLGWSDQRIASYLFMLNSEGGPREEDMFYKTPERVVEVFGKNKFFAGIEDYNEKVQKVKDSGVLQNPKLFGQTFYGDRMGNKGGTDGYDFRGRGFVQLTGRDGYTKVGNLMGIDLASNPDLVSSDPKIAWTSGAMFIQMNDPNNKVDTPEGMWRIIRPATSFQESLKRGRVPKAKELDEIARNNDSFNAVLRMSQKTTTPTKTPQNLPAPTQTIKAPPAKKEKLKDKIVITEDINAVRNQKKPVVTPSPADGNLNTGKISLQTWFEQKQAEEDEDLPPPDMMVRFPK